MAEEKKELTGALSRPVKEEIQLPSGKTLRRHKTAGSETFKMVQTVQRAGVDVAYKNYACRTMSIDGQNFEVDWFDDYEKIDDDDAMVIINAIDSVAKKAQAQATQ